MNFIEAKPVVDLRTKPVPLLTVIIDRRGRKAPLVLMTRGKLVAIRGHYPPFLKFAMFLEN
jgi:hypothetical protein